MKKKLPLILLFLLFAVLFSSCSSNNKPKEEEVEEKPVIYLYPTEKTTVSVKLDYEGELECTYPKYNGEWKVTAYPDGRLINRVDNKEYSYLFWEGRTDSKFDFSKGFVIKGEDTEEFLQTTLSKMGLLPKEYNEFIVYWLPRMQNNTYNLISFQHEAYTTKAKLIIEPKPDSLLRVFMAYKPLNKKIEIEPQEIKTFSRDGFTVIEWGGSKVD